MDFDFSFALEILPDLLRGAVVLNHRTADRVLAVNLPGKDTFEFRIRLPAEPHRSEDFSPWHLADRVASPVAGAPRIGASSRLPGRWPTHISSIGSSSIAGTTRHAASSNDRMPPAVSVVSKPFSSTVAPRIKRPSRRGTR